MGLRRPRMKVDLCELAKESRKFRMGPFLETYKKIKKLKKDALYYLTSIYRMATSKKHTLPDFLVIGAIKGGTTFLRTLLFGHPQILMALGETDYFNKEYNYKRGELWYRSHFPLQNEVAVGDLVGEKTPTYLFSLDAAKRIQKDLPNAKLICLLRNPTERAISNYFMAVKEKKEHLPIMGVMLSEETRRRSYKKRGLYLEQLKRYESYLKKKQLLILSSEEFFANPQKILRRLYKYLHRDFGW